LFVPLLIADPTPGLVMIKCNQALIGKGFFS